MLEWQDIHAGYLEAVDAEDFAAISEASCCATSTTYESPTAAFVEEEISLSFKRLVIDKRQPNNMLVSIIFC